MLGAAALASSAQGRLLLTREAAIAHVYGDSARAEAVTLYLTPSQLDTLRARARAPFDQARVTYYRVTSGATPVGHAFVDRHVVRTSSETVLIALHADGRVRAVEVLAWNEPEDYFPPERWLDRAKGASDPSLVQTGAAMPRIAGATLTSRAVTAAIRRALALDAWIRSASPTPH